jgi:hypothetical protein
MEIHVLHVRAVGHQVTTQIHKISNPKRRQLYSKATKMSTTIPPPPPPPALAFAPAVFPAARFPAAQYTYQTAKNFTGTMPQAVLQQLYADGCVEVNNIPACNLTNAPHPLFQRQRFTNFTAAEYAVIQPSVLLASKLITDNEFLDFFMRMYRGRSAIDATVPADVANDHETIPDPTNHSQANLRTLTQQALLGLANFVSIRSSDTQLSAAKPLISAASFFNTDNYTC